MKDFKSDILATLLQKAINLVQNNGFTVVCVIADNNQVNAKMYQIICGDIAPESGILNMKYNDQKIFFLYNTAHIMKCIHNNWLNQTNKNQKFAYPQIFESMKSVMRLQTNALNASFISSCSPAVATESILQNAAVTVHSVASTGKPYDKA